MVDVKMESAATKLLEGQYKKAAMEFSKVLSYLLRRFVLTM